MPRLVELIESKGSLESPLEGMDGIGFQFLPLINKGFFALLGLFIGGRIVDKLLGII
ncbi:hypothetical protein XM38_038380 [Halomicronema hongdechloris C2206]|uniref:Uncharacterized protein n=1 Tax=Halomicronema hongdechloris C2206 TaxID=1641165 RepID=A0A1Z3HRH3_9CYAN|nr:hypothetical protein [Halomicronema hongdechloris]ASC72878.1 hypothetical protein XM38_038380 [Halomicronema hongdechloris C2206]